jgi:hypothetical protein
MSNADFRQDMCFALALRSLEDEEQENIRKYVHPVAFEIGGNIGLQTPLLADIVREVHVLESQQ